MDEIQDILAKYDRAYLERLSASTPEADQLALAFFEDVAEILDTLSRLKNVERNPTGFLIDDAPILGLLVRTSKLLKLIVWIYKEDSAEYAAIAERSLIEVAATATYLLRSDKSTMEDYRRCSYRNRYKMLKQAASRVRVLSQQGRAPPLALDQRKARAGGVGRTQLRRTDPERLAGPRQNVLRDLQGGGRRRPVSRGVRHLLGVRPRFLARRPRLLLARQCRPRLLAAV